MTGTMKMKKIAVTAMLKILVIQKVLMMIARTTETMILEILVGNASLLSKAKWTRWAT